MDQEIELSSVVLDFAAGLEAADALRPEWVSRSGRAYSAGIGPHAEVRTVELVVDQMRASQGRRYGAIGPVDYPQSRLKCDLGIGNPLEWAIEVKMARALETTASSTTRGLRIYSRRTPATTASQ
jgi:hypothetical protein